MAYTSPFKKRQKTEFMSSGKTDLGTVTGLQQTAQQANLEKRTQQILAQKGEQIKQIFSGGFISDIFDVLNALQYGVVGVLKGKGFSEGVRTRQSFSDKDALGDNGIPGVIGGIALDIAADPLTYIAPWTVLKRVPGLVKGGSAIKKLAFGKQVEKAIEIGGEGIPKTEIEGGTKLGKYLAEKLAYRFGKDSN